MPDFISPLQDQPMGWVAGELCIALILYSLGFGSILHLCETKLNSTTWRLGVYLSFTLLFFMGFLLALVLFPQEKMLVIGICLSYNLIKIMYGIYKAFAKQ